MNKRTVTVCLVLVLVSALCAQQSITFVLKGASVVPVAADQALVVGLSPNGNNPCQSPTATLQPLNISLSTTSDVQLVALSGSTKIYICSMVIGWGGGTTPTFALEYGTGTNCGTGKTVITPATAITASLPNSFTYPFGFFATPSGQALCYVLTGTSPTGKLIATYVQQ